MNTKHMLIMKDSDDSVSQAPPQSLLEALDKLPKPPGPHQPWTFQSKGGRGAPGYPGPFTILREYHDVGCTCSYCGSFAASGRFGLKLPDDRGNHSWRVLWWRWRGVLHLVRWTPPHRIPK
jgi:hypothetical protein